MTASFHEPPDNIQKQIRNFKYLEKLDGAIAVGLNQLELLHEKIGGKAIQYIPHGVDTTFFSPTHETYEQFTCLFVGQHLRDFHTLEKTVFDLKKQLPEFKLKAVLREDFIELLPKANFVEIYSNISDEKLRELYRTSALLLLPLHEVTACNAILEALACGTPIVTTDLLGNRGYIDDDCAMLVKNNSVKDFTEYAITLIQNEQLNRKMRLAGRIRGLNFSWEKIATEFINYYEIHFNRQKN
jgi:glycosyltransferase involved in cell wall biosynthesis